ncbi:GldG family protein [Mordavella massiliensis]|nr:GldG family protein [Mordavella massiliensis]
MKGKVKTFVQNTGSAWKKGSYSVGMIVLVIAIAVLVNMIAARLPEEVRHLDISDNRIYEISDTSRELLKNLDQDVTFTVFAEKSSTDDRIKTFLEKYTSLTGRIKLEWVDPVLHPSELTENGVDSDTILVAGKETGKTTTIAFSDILVTDEYSYYTTGSTVATEFDGDGQLTSAVNFVTTDDQKKVYVTTGHGESAFSGSVSNLLKKNNMTEEELNLLMAGEIPEDCDLLFLYSPVTDLSEEEVSLLKDYIAHGGKVYITLSSESSDATPNLDGLLKAYGMTRADGYIADMSRNYQGNYYYIFPEISAYDGLTDGLSSNMVLLINAHGMTITDPEADTISVSSFLDTSEQGYAVTEENQTEGTYSLGAVATQTLSAEDTEEEADAEDDAEDEELEEGRLTVLAADSLINAQVTDSFTTLENLDLFMNTISSNFDDMQNVAIEAKSLEITYNTMQHAGLISVGLILGLPLVILVFGFVRWWKRRKA